MSILLAAQEGTTEQRHAKEKTFPPHLQTILEAEDKAEHLASDDTITATPEAGVDAIIPGDSEHLTETGILVGTPMYMAPELSEGSHVARAPADIFSLGVIAYELYTGEIPFARPPVWARWRGTEVAAPSLGVKRPDLGTEIIAVVDGCLHMDPGARPTADAISAALREVKVLRQTAID